MILICGHFQGVRERKGDGDVVRERRVEIKDCEWSEAGDRLQALGEEWGGEGEGEGCLQVTRR